MGISLSLIILGSLVVSLLFPYAAPVIGVALTLGGVVARRRSADSKIRVGGAVAIGTGVAILVIFVIATTMLVGGSQIQ